MLLLAILFQLVVLAILFFVLGMFVYIYSLLVSGAPFIPLPRESIEPVIRALGLRPDSIVYDLGSGDGRIVLAAAKAEPRAMCIGIDKALAAHAAALWNVRKEGRPPNVSFRKENIFDADISEATHVFCFLFPKLMEKLEPKFLSELRPGTKVVTCDYTFPNVRPAAVLPVQADIKFGKTIYVYTL